MPSNSKIISHALNSGFVFADHEEKIKKKKESLSLPLNETLEMLQELTEFDLGKFLLSNKGLNGFWTAYVILNGIKKSNLHPLERWMLNSSPIIVATRERFFIFQTELKKLLKDNMNIASTPCGLMDDLLSMDFSEFSDIKLTGIDIDQESLKLAEQNIQQYNTSAQTEFLVRSAWDLDISEEYDVIISNGLNIYEPDRSKLCELYIQLATAIKPNGYLITSFLTPNPKMSEESPWRDFSTQDAIKQKAIFADILEVAWQTYRTESEKILMFEESGFKVQNIIYDKQAMFPTIVLKKAS